MTKVSTRARRAINTMTRTRERCKLKCSVSDTFQLFRVKPLLFFAKLAAVKVFLLPLRHCCCRAAADDTPPACLSLAVFVLSRRQKKSLKTLVFWGQHAIDFPLIWNSLLMSALQTFLWGGSQARQFYLNKPVKVLIMGRRAICQTDALKQHGLG